MAPAERGDVFEGLVNAGGRFRMDDGDGFDRTRAGEGLLNRFRLNAFSPWSFDANRFAAASLYD